MSLHHTAAVFLASTLLWVGQGWAQVTLNTSAGGNTGGSNSTTLTISATIAAGSNTNIYVCVADNQGNLSTISGVTWNGTSLTSLASSNASDQHKAELFRLKAPSTGTANVVVTAPTSRRMAAAVIVLDGVDQTTSERTASTNYAGSSNTTPTVTVASSQSGDYILDCVARGQLENDTATAGASQTSLIQSRANGFNDVGVLTSTETAAGSNTVMDWTLSSSRFSTSIGIPIIAASGGGGGGTAKNLMLMGVGQ